MSRIGIDATPLAVGGKGLSRYLREYLWALAENPGNHHYSVFLNKQNQLPELPGHKAFTYVPVSFPSSIFWEQILAPRLARQFRLDLFHALLDRIPLLLPAPLVMYLFEIPDHRIEISKRNGRTPYEAVSQHLIKVLFPSSLKKATRIMVSSKSTRRDLEERYSVSAEKIRLVYPAANSSLAPAEAHEVAAIRRKLQAPHGYVLHFSSDDPRDNTPTVLSAYAKAVCTVKDPPALFIAGTIGRTRERLIRQCQALGISSRVRLLGYRDDADVAELYQGATVYFDPSWFEGFGFQVAEAMACGIPILASNVTSLPELLGDAGIAAAPDDTATFARALAELLTNADLRSRMAEASFLQSRRFSWQKTATETLKVYEEVLALETSCA